MVIIHILLFAAVVGATVSLIGAARALWTSAAQMDTQVATPSKSVQDTTGEGPRLQKCPECGAEMPADNRFCGQCGTPLEEPTCPSCASAVSAADRFCGACGAALGED